MRSHLLILLLLASCGSPDRDASDSRTVRFEIAMTGPSAEGWFDGAADSVGIRGSAPPLSWTESYPLTDEDGDDVWEAEVTFAEDAPTIIQYKLFVEGEGNPNGGWERGDNRWLNRETMRTVRRPYEDSSEPLPATYTGAIVEHTGFGGGDSVRARDLIVWLPPGYEADAGRRYPVLYLHDGQNVFDRRAVGAEWGMDETATRLIEEGAIEPVILVGVANTADRMLDYTPVPGGFTMQFERTGEGRGDSPLAGTFRMVGDEEIQVEIRGRARLEVRWEGESDWIPAFQTEDRWYVPSMETYITADDSADGRVQRFTANRDMGGGGGRAYARFLVEEVKPFIDAMYRTLPDRASTSVGGSSLGGLITMSIGTWHPDVFGGLLVVSPSVWWRDTAIPDMVREASFAERPRIWLDMGTAEGPLALQGVRELRDLLIGKGWTPGEDLAYLEDVGAPHNEDAWAGRAEGMLRFLYGR
jgi:predicted alpha/beta superfamily hydrolase